MSNWKNLQSQKVALPKYRVFRHSVKYFRDIEHTDLSEIKYVLKIHEVAYDIRKKTEIYGHQNRMFVVSKESIDLSECLDSLKNELTLIKEAFNYPVIDYETWEEIKDGTPSN